MDKAESSNTFRSTSGVHLTDVVLSAPYPRVLSFGRNGKAGYGAESSKFINTKAESRRNLIMLHTNLIKDLSMMIYQYAQLSGKERLIFMLCRVHFPENKVQLKENVILTSSELDKKCYIFEELTICCNAFELNIIF